MEHLEGAKGMTPRVFSKRSEELQSEGFIHLIVKRPNLVRWDLAQKRWDSTPILDEFIKLGSKWDRSGSSLGFLQAVRLPKSTKRE